MSRFALIAFFCLFFRADGAADSLRFVCYNVENYLTMDRWNEGRIVKAQPKPEKSKEAVVSILKELNPDIIGLVEIGTDEDLEDLQSRLSAVGVNLPHRVRVGGSDTTRFLGLLSRFPIRDNHSRPDVPLEVDGKPYRMQRGILDVSLQISDNFTLRLVGVHLKSRREVPEFNQATMRAMETRALRNHINHFLESAPETPLLVFGDFNDLKNSPSIRDMLAPKGKLELKDILLTDQRGEKWTYFWAAADDYSRIDYLFTSKALWPRVILEKSGIYDGLDWRVASDHRPLYLTLKLPEE